MTMTALREMVKATPFQPFYVKMADGTRYEVRHPETIMVGKALCVVLRGRGDDESVAILDLKLMTEAGPIS
jgi:hypothetical protein